MCEKCARNPREMPQNRPEIARKTPEILPRGSAPHPDRHPTPQPRPSADLHGGWAFWSTTAAAGDGVAAISGTSAASESELAAASRVAAEEAGRKCQEMQRRCPGNEQEMTGIRPGNDLEMSRKRSGTRGCATVMRLAHSPAQSSWYKRDRAILVLGYCG